jgi:DNA-binding beta-propeller fold protein YncE
MVMRRMRILTGPLLAAFVLTTGTAQAAPGDPYVVYTANNYADGAVVLRTDPASGSLVEISRNGAQGTLFERPFDLAVEADGSLVIADMGEPNQKDGSIIRVDPLTGAQSLVSSGGEFFDPAGIAVAPGGDLYVADNYAPDNDGAVIRVNPKTGAQQLISRNGMGGSYFDLPFGIAVDRDGSLVVANRMSPAQLPASCPPLGRVIRVSQFDGDQDLISQSGGGFEQLIGWPLGLAVDSQGSIVMANECDTTGGLVRVNPLDGDQSIITSNNGQDVLRTPERVAIDPDGALLVSDFSLGSDGDGGIVRVDPVSGAQTLVRQHDLFNHPLGIAAVVNRPPSAALALDPPAVAAGRPTRLDGSGSRDPEGLRLVYEWDLDGDGDFETGSGTTATATRTFSLHGPATVRMRVNDPHGGRAVAEGVVNVDGSIPVITGLRAGARVLGVPGRRGGRAAATPPRATSLRFSLSEAATVKLAIRRARAGRRVPGGACRPRAKRGRRCTRLSLRRTITHAGKPGANRIRIRARGLRPGSYRVVLSPTDLVGNEGVSRTVKLRVVRVPR